MTRAFRALWTASTAANLADGVFKLALPLYVAASTGSPAQVAAAMTAFTAPWLLLSLPLGAWADATDRRWLGVGANLLRFGVLLGLVALHAGEGVPLPVLYALAFLMGSAEVVADTASGALLPNVVEPSRLEAANARIVGAHTVGNEFLGPALGGWLFAKGMGIALWTSGGLYLGAAAALLFLRGAFRAAQAPAAAPRAATAARGAALLQGLAFLLRHRLLLRLTLLVTAMNVCWSVWLTLMPLYAVRPGPVGLSPQGFGLMMTALGLGGVLGTLLAVPMQRRLGTRRTIGIDVVGTAMLLAVPAMWPVPWPIAGAAVVAGAGGTVWGIVAGAMAQRIIPDEVRGRVGTAMRLFGYGALPLGALLAGLLAEAVGIRLAFALCALPAAALLLPFWRWLKPEALAAAPSVGGGLEGR